MQRKEMKMIPKECPINKPHKYTPKKNLEAKVIRDCLALLHNYPGVIYVERRTTGAVKFTDGGFIRFGSPGAADIWCLLRRTDGTIMHIELEMKRADGRGKLSPAQESFRAFCNDCKIPYYVITSIKELQEALLCEQSR